MSGRGQRGRDLKPATWRSFREASRNLGLFDDDTEYTAYWQELIGEDPFRAMQIYVNSLPKDMQLDIDGTVELVWKLQSPMSQDPSNLNSTNKQKAIDSSSQSAIDDGAKPLQQLTTSSNVS